jgi:multiple antibiotic resistance protein
MLDLVFNTFVILIVVIDPVGLAPMFVGLTQGGSVDYRRRMAVKGTMIAGLILILFVLGGTGVLRVLGIGLPAFRIAGGLLLMLLAIDMVFAWHSGLRSTTSEEQREAEHRADISVFPLAIPLIAGPGAFTTVLLMLGRTDAGTHPQVVVIGVLLVVLAITLVALLLATRIVHLIGETGANVISRVLGVLLAALAVQYIIDGIRTGLFTGGIS